MPPRRIEYDGKFLGKQNLILNMMMEMIATMIMMMTTMMMFERQEKWARRGRLKDAGAALNKI